MMMSSAYLCDGDDGNEDDVDGGDGCDDEDGGVLLHHTSGP